MTIHEAPPGEISLLLPDHWFALPLDPPPDPAGLKIDGWDADTTSKLTDLLASLGRTGKSVNIIRAAAAIYDVGGEVTVTSVAAGYQRLPELATLGEQDLTEIFKTADTTGEQATAKPGVEQGASTETSHVSAVDLPAGSAVRRQRSFSVSDDHPSTIIIDFVIRATAIPDTAVTLSFSAFGARPDAFVGLFDGLATGLRVKGRQ